ncbi:sulfurtransferase-like selenium metabolism protein YedF [Clostridium sp. MCC353]|nr:sulfurtransferase-like selenium metabolism protein YedF [Clostridium sp. MCC353]
MIDVNAMGDQCPIPVVKAKRALDQAGAGDVIQVQVDNEIAVQNLTKMAKNQDFGCTSEKVGEKHFVVTIQGGNGAAVPGKGGILERPEMPVCCPDSRKNTIVVIDSATMGTGNEELGRVLMKGFIYAVSQLDRLPSKVIFYNGGVTLTTEGSDSIEDLKSMEAQGVEILSCGTCLNYYGLSEKLLVGEVTNMYNIAEAMEACDKIIKP